MYKPYLALVRETPRCDPSKEFIKELDRLVPTSIWHNAAFRTYRSRKDFAGIWDGSIESEEPELELAVRLLVNYDNRQAAESLITAWWKKHGCEVDPVNLEVIVDEAMQLTEEKRAYFRTKQQEEKAAMYVTKTKSEILNYLEAQPGRPADIADALGKNRKMIGMQLIRLHDSGQVVRDETGLYRMTEE